MSKIIVPLEALYVTAMIELRIGAGYSQMGLAAALGLTQGTVSRMESSGRGLTVRRVIEVLGVIDVSLHKLHALVLAHHVHLTNLEVEVPYWDRIGNLTAAVSVARALLSTRMEKA